MDPVTIAGASAAAKGIKSAASVAQGAAAITKAASSTTSSDSRPHYGHGPNAALAKIIEQGDRGLKITKETAGMREVMQAFFRLFGSDQGACEAIGFNAAKNQHQGWLSRMIKDQKYIITVNIDFLSDTDTHHTNEDLRVYMVFKDFLHKRKQSQSKKCISNHTELIIALTPRIFSHYAAISPTSGATERAYKAEGLSKLSNFLEDCSRIAYAQSSRLFASDIDQLLASLESTSWHTHVAAKDVDTHARIDEYAQILQEQVAMLQTWNVRVLFSCMATKVLPPDLAAKTFDLTSSTIISDILNAAPNQRGLRRSEDTTAAIFEALHKVYQLDPSIHGATLLSSLARTTSKSSQLSSRQTAKVNLYRDLIEILQLPCLLTACLDHLSQLGKQNVSRLSAGGLHQRRKVPSEDIRCQIAQDKAHTFQQLRMLLDDPRLDKRINIFTELRKPNSRGLTDLLNLSLHLNTKLVLLSHASNKFYNLCSSVRDDAARTEGIAEFITLVEDTCAQVTLLHAKLSDLYAEQSGQKRKSVSDYNPLVADDTNREWVREIVSTRGIMAHVRNIQQQTLQISAIIPVSDSHSKNADNWAQKEWILSVCVIMRDTECLAEQITKQSKAAIPEKLLTILNCSGFMLRLQRKSEAFLLSEQQQQTEPSAERILRSSLASDDDGARAAPRGEMGMSDQADAADTGEAQVEGHGEAETEAEGEGHGEAETEAEGEGEGHGEAETEAEGEGEDGNEEVDRTSQVRFHTATRARRSQLERPSADNLEDLIFREFSRGEKEKAHREQCERAAETLISMLNSALTDYSLWRANECSWAGKFLTGSHSHAHYLEAKSFVETQRETLLGENLTVEDIEQVTATCTAFGPLNPQGFFARPTAEPLAHSFDHYLESPGNYEHGIAPD